MPSPFTEEGFAEFEAKQFKQLQDRFADLEQTQYDGVFILRQNPVPREVIDNSFHLSVLIKRHKDGRTAPRIPAIRLRSLLRQGAPKDDGPINKLENQARLGIKDLATRNDELRKTIAELKTHIRNTTYFVETAAKIAK